VALAAQWMDQGPGDGDRTMGGANKGTKRGSRKAAMQVIESCNSTWIFDTKRMRFRRVPKGTPLDLPAAADDWTRYYNLELDLESGAFLVTLNESGSRLLRSFRHTEPCSQCEPNATTEMSLEALRRKLGSNAEPA
jgi:hypothetical protein